MTLQKNIVMNATILRRLMYRSWTSNIHHINTNPDIDPIMIENGIVIGRTPQ
jgi:hypothetical protein